MQCNLSRTDRTVRIGLGVLAVVAGLAFVQGLLGIALALVGAVLVFSGTIGFCHVYKVLGIRTRRDS
jgi:hypothetical protein